jgi:hypothetical protein
MNTFQQHGDYRKVAGRRAEHASKSRQSVAGVHDFEVRMRKEGGLFVVTMNSFNVYLIKAPSAIAMSYSMVDWSDDTCRDAYAPNPIESHAVVIHPISPVQFMKAPCLAPCHHANSSFQT